MKMPSALLFTLALATALVAHASAGDRAPIGNESAAAPTGSQAPVVLTSCILCHQMPELFPGDKRKFVISQAQIAASIHLSKGVGCHDCHGGNPAALNTTDAHATVVAPNGLRIKPFQLPLTKVQQMCTDCHQQQSAGLAHGVHAKAGKDKAGNRRPLRCSECHGENIHEISAVDDPNAPVFANHQVALCGKCHQQQKQEYDASVHGRGLHKAGLLVAAVCSDCHGAHAIYAPRDKRSSLYRTNVATTCAKCHRFIEQRLRRSVHGRGAGLGAKAETTAPGGTVQRHPTCTDCHAGHDLPDPRSSTFRLRLADQCGNCHDALQTTYALSMHGALTNLGHAPSAKCSDCHGAHDILPLDDPNCRLAPGANRIATCRKCHPDAVPNFCDFLPHANHKAGFDDTPILHGVYLGMELLIYSVFAFFGLHSVFWFGRSLVHVFRHGRARRLVPGTTAYVRFQGIHRLLHVIVATSFLGLALTGLPLRYSEQPWAQSLAGSLGGFESTGTWHRICGIITILYFTTHLGWLAKRIWIQRRQKTSWRTLLFGPDSPVPNVRDFIDMFRMGRWFIGLGPKPAFERWTYWEKFDYWAVFWGVGIIGTSGLMLWFPNFFCRFLPGESLNVAKIVHSEEALLATSFIFAIHFFGTHLRPEKFPMDMSVLSGLVSPEEMREERSEYYERMRREGKLETVTTVVPPRKKLVFMSLAGLLALLVGLALLAGIAIAIVRAGGH